MSGAEVPSAEALRTAFDHGVAYTVGIEDEIMLLDPRTLELTPRAQELLGLAGDCSHLKLELPAAQIEIITPPCPSVDRAAAHLRHVRQRLSDLADGVARLAAAGAHPFSPGVGALNRIPRYEQTITEYGSVATRQLVSALQVHISVGGSERALAVYNTARSYLPYIAALAANAPFYEGRDTGLASVRPKLCELLPRQGVPPAIDSWEAYAQTLAWGARSGAFANAGTWWWELRMHPRFGTLEFRVPDGQSTVADIAAIAAVIQALVAWLCERHEAGQRLGVSPSWRIDENRWSACRHGVEGTMADLDTGEQRPTRSWLNEFLDWLSPVAERLGTAARVEHARALVQVNGAIAQRRAARRDGPRAAAAWLAERFLQ